ncbi:MAG: sensor histidine kinase [Parvularculaceae bacterium]
MKDDERPSMTHLEIAADRQGPFLAAAGKTGRAMNWFFADKERMFWILQTAGWFGFFVLHVVSVSTFIIGPSWSSFVYSAASSAVGFLTTSIIMRPVYRLARNQGPVLLLLIAITATLVMAVAMSAVKAETFIFIFGDEWLRGRSASIGSTNFLLLLIPDLPANLLLLLSWGGFYFGINYYLTLRSETQRALVAARLADQAQLKMLRYQLNPHFLFNTLNAISTLVLENESKFANSMLTRLSAFLRYSLDSDPLQKTTLSEEVRALQLYLDIEKARFGERLSVKKDIDEDALDALAPSLILQPAIENAIKYAIAQMESGGEITIVAKREGEMLRLEVCDNGPNAPDDPESLLRGDSGVGLVNMRERLAYLYGENQSFSLVKLEPQGLCVRLTLPFETRT